MEAIILAGGMGTRLRSVVAELPKCMAPVNNKPFLYYLLQNLEESGFTHIILSLGYKHEVIEEWIKTYPSTVRISTVIEEVPLGTGGGVKLALSKAEEESVFILNGDTYLEVSYQQMMNDHFSLQTTATLALKEMKDFDRYGVVSTDSQHYITEFKEKQPCAKGSINGGLYIIKRCSLDDMPAKFSLEKDFFEKRVATKELGAYFSDGYFIDIGIPSDYERAQNEFKDELYKTL